MASPRELYAGRVALLTGGTKGIGLATALAFGRHGARTVLTYGWGSADLDDVKSAVEFASVENMRKLETSSTFSSGRMQPGDKNNPDSFKVRRAKVGGYRDYFEDDQIERIDAMVREQLSPAFGYEGAGVPAPR